MNRLGGRVTTPWHVWAVGVLAVLWNGFGATDYTMTQLRNRSWFEAMGFDAGTTEVVLEFLAAAPAWSDAAWALGVWGGLAGSLLLLMRSGWSVVVFALSLVGVIGSMIFQAQYQYPPELAEMANSPIMWVVFAIAVFLLIYAWVMRKRGVLA